MRKQEAVSEMIGASVRDRNIDKQSESQVTANGGEYQNFSRLGGSVLGGGGISPNNISPLFKKKRFLGQLNNGALMIHYDDDKIKDSQGAATSTNQNGRGIQNFQQLDTFMKLNPIKPTPQQIPTFQMSEKQNNSSRTMQRMGL